jgi:hypothetical protein
VPVRIEGDAHIAMSETLAHHLVLLGEDQARVLPSRSPGQALLSLELAVHPEAPTVSGSRETDRRPFPVLGSETFTW